MSDDLVIVDQESTSKGKTGIIENAVLISDILLDVSEKRDVNRSKSSIFTRVQSPSTVHKVRVDGGANDLAVVVSEVLGLVAEVDDFSGADEGEVKGVEEEQQPLLAVVLQRELLELVGTGQPGLSLEVRGYLADRSTNQLRSHDKIC